MKAVRGLLNGRRDPCAERSGARSRLLRTGAGVLALLCVLVPRTLAQEQTDAAPASRVNQPVEPEADQSPDEAVDLLFQDFDVVVTAGRSAQAISETGVPVSVLTAQDIHLSGITSLPDLFQFVPGMDVLQVDRNRFAVGVRGLHQEFSDRTLVLIDGRNATSALFGGVDFQRLPVFIEDLERIEVVRGPGGAVWGPNAFNGVINLIRKDPRDTQGVFLSSTLNEFGDQFHHFRWGASAGDLAWRVSFGYDKQESSDDAINNDAFFSRDFSRVFRFDGEAVYGRAEQTELRVGVGHTHTERGDFPFVGLQTGRDERIDHTRIHAKLSHRFNESASGYVRWYGTFEDVNRPSLWRYSSADNTIEGLLDLKLGDSHEVTLGGSARIVRIDAKRVRATDLLGDRQFNEQWLGFFVVDRWHAADWLTLESQARVDWYSETSVDWSGRVSALIRLDGAGRHVLRLSGAKAFRAPQSGLQQIQTRRFPLPPPAPPGLFGTELLRPGRLDNEEIWSIEAGYTGQLAPQVAFRVDGYYQFYQDLTGAVVLPDPLGIGRVLASIDNLGGAEAYGIETQLTIGDDPARISLWYAYNAFDFNEGGGQNARAFLPAEHKVGILGRVRLTDSVTASANYRYTSQTRGDVFTGDVREQHRLDLTLANQIVGGRGEITLGVLDVFDETSIAIDSITGGGVTFSTPGRTLFVRFQLRF